jgi:tRNA pseudouridine32 synthase/23S rRNA pseudouridine746 synthase
MDVTGFPPILHQGRGFLVVDKPAGLAVHAGPRTPHALEAILAMAPGPRLRPVHRLDRDTSGCLVLASRDAVLRRLATAFAERRVEKDYWAVLEGTLGDDAGVIDAPLVKTSTRERGWRMVPRADGLAARTQFEVLMRAGGRSLVRFRPQTGRTHQIRAHAMLLGAPIVGDPVYGRGNPAGMLLHARRLRLPVDDLMVEVVAPLPERFRAAGFGPVHRLLVPQPDAD